VVLSACRPVGLVVLVVLSACRPVGLSACRPVGLSACRPGGPGGPVDYCTRFTQILPAGLPTCLKAIGIYPVGQSITLPIL